MSSSSFDELDSDENESVTESESEAGVPTAPSMSSIILHRPSSQEEYFCTDGHAEASLNQMESYFMNQKLTDVVLIAGNKRIPAHKLVLSAGSEYFAAMFTSDLREATQKEIELQNVDGDALWALVHYCYTGVILLTSETVENLFGTARLLQLHKVVNACCTFLKKQLHPSNCIGIQSFADSHGCGDLLEISRNYTAEHFSEVVKNEEFLMLSADELAKLLASDDLNVLSEENVFHALMVWLAHDLQKRSENISRLLSYVKLPLLPPAFIVDHIESVPLFYDNPKCRELIMEAFKYQLLPERRSKLQSRRTFPRKSTIGNLYALGGVNTRVTYCVEKYDVRTDNWNCFGNMTLERLQFGVAVVEGKLYVVGGRDGLKTVKTAECYDIKTLTRTPLPPMLTQRHGLGVGVLGGSLYAVGGHDGWSYLNTVERWDPETGTWNSVAHMATQRSTLGLGVLNGKLYAVGGKDGSSCLKTVECYNPHTNKWTFCASMTKRRGGVGVGVLNGYMYAVGGHDGSSTIPTGKRFECVERYNPKTDVWQLIASLSIGRDAVGVCPLGDRLFAVGGYDGMFYLTIVEAYDPESNKWHKMASLDKERAGSCVFAFKS